MTAAKIFAFSFLPKVNTIKPFTSQEACQKDQLPHISVLHLLSQDVLHLLHPNRDDKPFRFCLWITLQGEQAPCWIQNPLAFAFELVLLSILILIICLGFLVHILVERQKEILTPLAPMG